MTAGQATADVLKRKFPSAYISYDQCPEVWEAAAQAAIAWKEPTLFDIAEMAYDEPIPGMHTSTGPVHAAKLLVAALAVAAVERAAIRKIVDKTLLANSNDRRAILAAIDARGT